MNPVILLGACSGAGTLTAALRAIQKEAQSDLPALGYTVPYAIGNIVLTAWGSSPSRHDDVGGSRRPKSLRYPESSRSLFPSLAAKMSSHDSALISLPRGSRADRTE